MPIKPIKIVKNRSDIGAGTRGADMGIDAVEVAAINAGSDYFARYPYVDVETCNESVYEKVSAPFAKRIEKVHWQCSHLAAKVQDACEANFPVVLSGDHSSAAGTIAGIKAAHPDKRMGIVWLDAHADIHSPYTSPSGNIHGMPLSAALNNDNRECQVNEISEVVAAEWQKMRDLGVKGPKFLPEDLVFFGVRDTEEPENNLIDRLKIKNYQVEELRTRGIETCLNEAKERLSKCDIIYISFDVDSMCCDLISMGTGTPVADGLTPEEAEKIMTTFLDTEKVVCLEVAEVNPLLDNKGNRMAEVTFDVLDRVTNHMTNAVKSRN